MNNLKKSKEIGQRIKYLRDQKNVSQTKLASELKMSQHVLNRIELGTRAIRDEELIKLSDYFGVTSDYLLGHVVDLGNTTVAAHMDNDLTEDQKKKFMNLLSLKNHSIKKKMKIISR